MPLQVRKHEKSTRHTQEAWKSILHKFTRSSPGSNQQRSQAKALNIVDELAIHVRVFLSREKSRHTVYKILWNCDLAG
jgi:hypothetical protein